MLDHDIDVDNLWFMVELYVSKNYPVKIM